MSMEQFSSTLAPAICGLIRMKRDAGTKYTHGEVLLGQFDRFCSGIGYNDTVLSEKLVIQWKKHNENRKHRQKSQMITYVRHLGRYLASKGMNTYIPPMEYYSGTSDPIELSSVFGPYISDFIMLKRANGYSYNTEERLLYRFDRYCSEAGITEPLLTRDMIYGWAAKTTCKSMTYFRQFAKYLLSVGMEAYIPRDKPSQSRRNPYILSGPELSAFFAQVDSFQPGYRSCDRMAAGYSIMFRLYYCCGMRLQEVCMLAAADVDLSGGKILIRNAKGHKDRVIFVHEDILKMCQKYDAIVKESVTQREWFFPARDINKPIPKTNMSRRFDYFWSKTAFGDNTVHSPTVHSLRHTFVVNRINHWIKAGCGMEHMMPYLSRYLGHKTIEETHYYYHLAAAATDIIRSHDLASEKNIPEVTAYEEI